MASHLSNPPFLYRYRPLARDENRTVEKVVSDEIALIRKGFIWTSKPKNLNDPFDCRPIAHPDQVPVLERLLDRFFVGSLSATPPTEPEAGPMWSYYANNHRGICIEFPFDRARSEARLPVERVRYTDSRYDARVHEAAKMRITSPARIGVKVAAAEIFDPKNNIDILELTRKANAWKHEQEWRYIWNQHWDRPKETVAREIAEHGPGAEQMAFISKPSRVILGANISRPNAELISELLRPSDIPLVKARLSLEEYRLEI